MLTFCAKITKQEEKETDLGSFSQASRHCRPEVKGSISKVIKYAYLQKEESTRKVILGISVNERGGGGGGGFTAF